MSTINVLRNVLEEKNKELADTKMELQGDIDKWIQDANKWSDKSVKYEVLLERVLADGLDELLIAEIKAAISSAV